MTSLDWERVIGEAADLGVPRVQFIGGEPTTHPDLPGLVGQALSRQLEVEVYTNLLHVTPKMWDVFSRPGVRIGTSCYSDAPDRHQAITGAPRSHRRTIAAITTAVERQIPIRVGLVGANDGTHVSQTVAMLTDLGVRDVYVDRVRRVGRALQHEPEITELCGLCAGRILAVLPNGTVSPCPISRWLIVGSVRQQRLQTILTSGRLTECRDRIHKYVDNAGSSPTSGPGVVTGRCAPP